jgi:hypothetical protein
MLLLTIGWEMVKLNPERAALWAKTYGLHIENRINHDFKKSPAMRYTLHPNHLRAVLFEDQPLLPFSLPKEVNLLSTARYLRQRGTAADRDRR